MNYDDWFIVKDSVKMLTNKWGKVSIDTFASHANKKTKRFNSKYICPGSEDVNRFSVDWSNKNSLPAPPVYFTRQYWYVHTVLLQHFDHCYLKRRESFRV